MREIRYSAVDVGAAFIDSTYGAEWEKLANGMSKCLCGAGQNKLDDVKSFSPHFLVELSEVVV